MTLKRTSFMALAAMLAIAFNGLSLSAEDLNLSNSQVFKIQALLLAENEEIRQLTVNVQEAREALREAVAQGDPMQTAVAVLSLDAAEKALKATQLASRRTLLSILEESQKNLLTTNDSAAASVSASN
jgi:hypothetical protein